MIHAYNELYVNDVMHTLSSFFDLAINGLKMEPDDIATLFQKSEIATGIENGDPRELAGKSATEMLSEVLKKDVLCNQAPIDRSPEYWAGWILAYTQWYLNCSFKEILEVMPFSQLIRLYHPYHEAPESKTIERIQSLFPSDNRLKRYRKMRGLSQKQLSDLSGVKIRSIQCYEQGDIEIGKAQAETLYALAKVLDCSIESLLH